MKVYKVTNLKTGKIYVGQTCNDLVYRFKHHCKPSSRVPALRDAIKKYGKESFKIELIVECKTQEEANQMEVFYIKELNTMSPNGYNLEEGGKVSPRSLHSIAKSAASKKGMAYRNRRRGIIATEISTGNIVEVEVVKDFLNYGFSKSNLSNIRWVLTKKSKRTQVKGWNFEYKSNANQNLIIESKKSMAVQRIGGETSEKKNINVQETSTPK